MRRVSGHKSSLVVALLVVGIAPAPRAKAQTTILDFTGGTTGAPQHADSVAGWEFTVSSPVAVNGICLWDEGANGLAHSHDAGLWTAGGTLLASGAIDNAATPVPSTSSDGDWLCISILSQTLSIGDYVLGSTIQKDDPDVDRGLTTIISTVPGVTYVQGREVASSTLTFPTVSKPGANGVFGPNLEIPAAVPEPGSLTLMATLILPLGFTFLRRKTT